jgi:hypothetical protein
VPLAIRLASPRHKELLEVILLPRLAVLAVEAGVLRLLEAQQDRQAALAVLELHLLLADHQ